MEMIQSPSQTRIVSKIQTAMRTWENTQLVSSKKLFRLNKVSVEDICEGLNAVFHWLFKASVFTNSD